MEQLNLRLSAVKEKLRNREKLQKTLANAQEDLTRDKARLKELETILQKEDADIQKFEGLSLTALFYTILGSKQEQLEMERREYLAAKLQYDKCQFMVSSLEREIENLKGRLAEFGDLDKEYQSVFRQKEVQISEAGDERTERLFQLTGDLSDLQADLRELGEAIQVGEQANDSLDQLVSALKSASGWGTWDMLGGDFLATAIKHSKIDQAQEAALKVQQILARFQKELSDVETSPTSELAVQLGSFETFADYFIDNLITDWIVQSRIQSSLENAIHMRENVGKAIGNLVHKRRQVEQQVEDLERVHRTLIEDA